MNQPLMAAARTKPFARQDNSTERAYWTCQAIGWGIYAVIMFFFQVYFRDEKQSLEHAIWSSGAIILVAVSVGLFMTQKWRRFMRARHWIERTGGLPLFRLLGGICILAFVEMTLLFLAYMVLLPESRDNIVTWLKTGMPGTLIGWLSIYLVWTIMYVATVSRRHTRRMEIEKVQLELNMKDAELRALQAQVNPHFFFNSLNSIRALIYQDAHAAAEVIDRLASMMRYTLQSGRTDTVPWAQEMRAVHDYLAIEKIRFEERLTLSESIDPQLDDMAFPPMIMQTLVENAVKYGVELSVAPSELRITAKREGEQMLVTVSNQGQLREVAGSTKVGVNNAAKRLALIFGVNAGVDLFERDGWVTARLTLPCTPMAT